MKTLLLFLALGFSGLANAQLVQFISPNNVNAGFGTGGSLFTAYDTTVDGSNWRLDQAPKSIGVSPVFTAALWLTALDTGGNLHCAAQRYRQNGADYSDGPIETSYNANYDNYFTRVFKVTRTELTQFLQLQFPVQASAVPPDILYWPGYGNQNVLTAYNTDVNSLPAPFEDVDGDGIYNPLKGDYPCFLGEEAVFFIFNDERTTHTESGGAPLGLQINGLAQSFVDHNDTMSDAKNPVNNTVFVHYQVANASAFNYNNFYFTLWVDPDLGCFNNDRVGCDTARNLMFVYNGTTPDPDCTPEKGYGTLPVSEGIKFLNQDMNVFGYFTNGASLNTADPMTAAQYRNYSTGYWNDGTPFTEGGIGYGGTVPTRFIFPGDPNNITQWSELSVADSLPPGDRRMSGTVGPMNFSAGETKNFDFAFINSSDSTSDLFHIVDTLKRDADIVQQFYFEKLNGPDCSTSAAEVRNISNSQFLFSVYPNPANNTINIQCGQIIQSLEIDDILGRTILQKQVQDTHTIIDISTLPKGVYLVTATNGNSMAVKKLVVD